MATVVVFLVCSIIILQCPCWCSTKINFPDSSEMPILSEDTLTDIKNNDGSKFVNIYNEYIKTIPKFSQKDTWNEGEEK